MFRASIANRKHRGCVIPSSTAISLPPRTCVSWSLSAPAVKQTNTSDRKLLERKLLCLPRLAMFKSRSLFCSSRSLLHLAQTPSQTLKRTTIEIKPISKTFSTTTANMVSAHLQFSRIVERTNTGTGQSRRSHPRRRVVRGLSWQQGQPLERVGFGQRPHHRSASCLLPRLLRLPHPRLPGRQAYERGGQGLCRLGQRCLRVRLYFDEDDHTRANV